MKLGHKLLLAPVITAVVVLAAGQLDSRLLRVAGETAEGRFAAELGDIQSFAGVQNKVGQMHTSIYRAMTIIGSYDEGQISALRKDMAGRSAAVKTDLAALLNRGDMDTQARSDLEAASGLIDDYLKRSDSAVDLASIDPNTGVAAMQGADEVYEKLAKYLAEAAAKKRAVALEVSQVAANQTNRTHWLLTMLSLAVAAGVVGLFWVVLRRVAVALEQAAHVAREIAAGNLDLRVESSRQDELGDLLHALSTMKDSLRKTVQQVRSASENINTASAEIASGNQDLSARTEQAASNLEETAASMEELTATVRQSADAARQANQLAASASEIAVRGGQVVNQVVSTMDEINHSSKKISDIIGVIDGIAFQTNILALNAAVEAARAGEQGRGFAVVAGEVRNLAQRSAEAAKEIKGLIGASVDRVEAGSRLVADAGQTMSEIVGSVQRVSDIIGEITAASGEQSDGIGQVNTAVNQLDQMTQQNAALVEQSAAAAESLREQAGRLVQVVQVFRIDGSSATVSTPPVRHQAPARTAPTSAARPPAKTVHTPAVVTPRAAPGLQRPAPERGPSLTANAAAAPTARPLPVKPAKATVGAGDEGDWESF